MTRDQINRVIAYTRVSTSEQGDSGLGLEAQTAEIARYCAYRGWEIAASHQDVASGKSTNGRHGLDQALADLKARRADGLVVAKLDRLSRSLLDFAGLLDRAQREKWALICLDLDLDTSTSMGEAMAHMVAVFAQLERRRIGERTKAALAAKRERGERLGRLRMISPALEARIVRMRKRGYTYRAIAAKLTRDGVQTPSGGKVWSLATIQIVCQRHAVTSTRGGR